MQTNLSDVEATIDTRAKRLTRVSDAARALAATHVQEQLRHGNCRSPLRAAILIDRVQLAPERDRWLGPKISPARSWQFRNTSIVVIVGLVGLMAAAAITDI